MQVLKALSRASSGCQLGLDEWDDRMPALGEIGMERGMGNAKMTVIGQPGKISDRGSCVVLSIQQNEKRPALPKGIPEPSAVQTIYVAYVAAKQWRGVAEAAKDPEDTLIVEGWPQIDAETGTVALFATSVTSKKLQVVKRAGQQK
jgi:hypothetical protein